MTDVGGDGDVNAMKEDAMDGSSDVDAAAGTELLAHRELQHMRRVFERVPAPMHVIFVDRGYRIRHISENLVKYMGYKRVDDVGMEIAEFFPKEGDLIKAAIDTGRPIEKQEMFLGRYEDGKKAPVFASCNPVYDDGGEIIGAVAAFTEIADLKRAIEDAEENRNIMDCIPTTVMAIDRDFNVKINEAGAEVLGRQKSGCIGMKCHCSTRHTATRLIAVS